MDGTRRNGSLRTLIVAAAMVVPLLAVAPVFACGPTSTAHIAPEGGEPGTTATVTGSLFKATAGDVVIKWGGAGGVVLATAPVAADGSFGPVQVTVPADAERGRIAVLAVYQPADPSAKVSNVTFQVAGPPPAEAAPAQPAAQSDPAQPAQAVAASPAPAAQPAPAAVPAPAPRTRAAAVPAPAAPATTAAPAPKAAPAAVVSVPAPVPAASPIAPLVLPEITETAPAGVPVPGRADATGAASAREGGASPWAVVPLVAVGLTLLAVGVAAAYEPRRRRARSRS